MDMITVSAKTVDEAVTKALIELKTTSDKLEYEVVEEGSKVFLGLGAKPAVIRAKKKETVADALVILEAGILEEFGEQAENGTYEGAELYGVGYSLKTIALLDNGNIQGLAVPDGYEIGYKSVEEITKRIEHRSYKMQGYITEYQVLGKENFSMDEDLERFLYSYE